MPREVDPKRTRKALKRVRRLAALQTEAETPPDYSGWEQEFLTEVESRLDKFGSAFADLGKGRPEEALSVLQAQKLREIEQKARGKDDGDKPRARSSFKRKPPPWAKDNPENET